MDHRNSAEYSTVEQPEEPHIHPDFLEGVTHDMLYRFIFIILVHIIGFGLFHLYNYKYPKSIDTKKHDQEQQKLFSYIDERLEKPPISEEKQKFQQQFSDGAILRRR